ncbi:MAG: hypothetical protein IJX65_00245 [Alistipes sp.]|nr:hypothetical protein [Alistipes sp.]
MIQAIFYKERIKTFWYSLLALLTSVGFAGYCMLRVWRVCELKGVEHLWIVMMQKDVIFVDMLQFVPLFIGLALAVVQFEPEMQRKSFKLTLHLPIRATKALCAMLLYGVAVLLVVFLPAIALMWGYLHTVLAPELWQHILLTTVPWYLAGIATYLLTAWVSLEPTWSRRIVDAIMSLMLIRLFFLTTTPEAYNGFLPHLTVLTAAFSLLSMLSLTRFRDGRQD